MVSDLQLAFLSSETKKDNQVAIFSFAGIKNFPDKLIAAKTQIPLPSIKFI